MGCVIKTRTKAYIKGFGILPGGPDRSTVLRVRGHGTGPRSLARSTARRRALLRSHRDLRRIQTSTQSRKSFIIELDSETNKVC